MNRECPCCSGADYAVCCEPLHEGAVDAVTAEALMRARFSAFALGDAGYVRRTWHPATRPEDLDLDGTLEWTRLEVLEVVGGGPDDDTGTVTFRGHYRAGPARGVLTERSTFERRRGRWVYLDGETS